VEKLQHFSSYGAPNFYDNSRVASRSLLHNLFRYRLAYYNFVPDAEASGKSRTKGKINILIERQ